MQYMLLLHGDESQDADMTPEGWAEMMAEYNAYNSALESAGVLRGGAGLQPSHTATTLRDQDGTIHLTDGPYIETREQLGGYYIIDVANLDEAVAWAKKCPAMTGGSIEIRAILVTTEDD